MVAVSITDGIMYGIRIMVYFVGVIFIGLLVSSIGSGMLATGQGGLYESPDQGMVFLGIILVLIGFLITLAGLMGAFYKVIADAVQRGNQEVSQQ